MKVTSAAKAFSLVELLIVIAIISILSIMSAPVFSKFRGNANLKEAVREISGDILLCKHRAIAENVHYRIILSVANNNYIIQKETGPSTWINVGSAKEIGEDDASIKIAEDPTFASDTIIFAPRGTTRAGTLVLQHDKLLSKARIITSMMGRVRIQYELK